MFLFVPSNTLSIGNIVIEPSFLQYAKLMPACFRDIGQLDV